MNYKGEHNGTFLFSFNIINSNNFNMGREVMRIPINSTFTKEISKKFQRIFNPQTPLEELKNLQEESYMGSHVDNFIKEVQNKENNNGKSYETARAVRQEYSQREEIVGQVTSSKIQKKSDCVETTFS